jgi:hypothetical protein
VKYAIRTPAGRLATTWQDDPKPIVFDEYILAMSWLRQMYGLYGSDWDQCIVTSVPDTAYEQLAALNALLSLQDA